MNGEIYSYLYEKILEEGALDIYTQSIYMKKNRPATKISVICYEKDLDKFIEILLKETTTFGVRYNKYKRETLHRKFLKLNTIYGNINIKIGYYNGKIIKATPEFEDCKKIAKNEKLPLNLVYNEIISIINKKILRNH